MTANNTVEIARQTPTRVSNNGRCSALSGKTHTDARNVKSHDRNPNRSSRKNFLMIDSPSAFGSVAQLVSIQLDLHCTSAHCTIRTRPATSGSAGPLCPRNRARFYKRHSPRDVECLQHGQRGAARADRAATEDGGGRAVSKYVGNSTYPSNLRPAVSRDDVDRLLLAARLRGVGGCRRAFRCKALSKPHRGGKPASFSIMKTVSLPRTRQNPPADSLRSGLLLAPYRSDHLRPRSKSGLVLAAQRFSRAMTRVSPRVMAS